MLRRLLSFTLLSITMLSGCQKTNPHPDDPFEGFNREMYGLNKTIDKALIKPVAYVYWKYLPSPFQTCIGNFYDNLREIPNVANDLLQGKFAWASHDATRFLINSTLGIGGLFDPAGNLGLKHRREDFGQTLYVWGFETSPYLVLPILGPSTMRDAVGLVVDYYAFSVWPHIGDDGWRYGLLALDLIDIRARLLRHESVLSTVAVDEYAFVRDAYFQRRQYLVNNESEPVEQEPNPYESPSNGDSKLEAELKGQTKTSEETPSTVEVQSTTTGESKIPEKSDNGSKLEEQTKALNQDKKDNGSKLEEQTKAINQDNKDNASTLEDQTKAINQENKDSATTLEDQTKAINQENKESSSTPEDQSKSINQDDKDDASKLDEQTKATDQQSKKDTSVLEKFTKAIKSHATKLKVQTTEINTQ